MLQVGSPGNAPARSDGRVAEAERAGFSLSSGFVSPPSPDEFRLFGQDEELRFCNSGERFRRSLSISAAGP